MGRLNIPGVAKREAKKALRKRKRLSKSRKFGLNRSEAREAGVFSGVERARQIMRSESLSLSDAKRVASFYQRFKHCTSPKCEGALDLWGGRTFGRSAVRFVKKNKKRR